MQKEIQSNHHIPNTFQEITAASQKEKNGIRFMIVRLSSHVMWVCLFVYNIEEFFTCLHYGSVLYLNRCFHALMLTTVFDGDLLKVH